MRTEASTCGKVDDLRGLEENVILGRLIPAGMGLPAFERLNVLVEGQDASTPAERPRREEPRVAVNEE